MNKNLTLGLLACSVLMNAFLLGHITSERPRPPHGGPPSPLTHMEMAARHMESEHKDEILKLIKDRQSELDQNMSEIHQIFDEIDPVLTAPKFDPAKLKALHEKLYKHDERVKSGMLDLLTQIAKALPDEERIRFFEDARPDRRDFHDGFHGPPPPEDGGGPPAR